jgi:hypothetical protein
MFIRRNKKKVGTKVYETLLLVEGIRAGKKVRHKTVANLSKFPEHIVTAIENAISGESKSSFNKLPQRCGQNFGGLFSMLEIAKRIGIDEVLGSEPMGRFAMLMIFGRILTQGSRRHLTFWQNGYAIKEVLNIENSSTDDLYRSLDWIEEKQSEIEKALFERNLKSGTDKVFMYDITSSYLEGELNELAEYGYNRDGKKGKKQIVIGLVLQRHIVLVHQHVNTVSFDHGLSLTFAECTGGVVIKTPCPTTGVIDGHPKVPMQGMVRSWGHHGEGGHDPRCDAPIILFVFRISSRAYKEAPLGIDHFKNRFEVVLVVLIAF